MAESATVETESPSLPKRPPGRPKKKDQPRSVTMTESDLQTIIASSISNAIKGMMESGVIARDAAPAEHPEIVAEQDLYEGMFIDKEQPLKWPWMRVHGPNGHYIAGRRSMKGPNWSDRQQRVREAVSREWRSHFHRCTNDKRQPPPNRLLVNRNFRQWVKQIAWGREPCHCPTEIRPDEDFGRVVDAGTANERAIEFDIKKASADRADDGTIWIDDVAFRFVRIDSDGVTELSLLPKGV